MLQRCHSVNRLLKEWGCSCRDRCQPGPSRQLLSTATWTLQSRLDMRSFSYLTIRARDGAPLFRVGEIFRCHSGGYSQSLVRRVLIPAISHPTAITAIVFLFLAAPLNIYSAYHRVNFGGQAGGSAYLLVRLSIQLFLIAWIWWFALRTS